MMRCSHAMLMALCAMTVLALPCFAQDAPPAADAVVEEQAVVADPVMLRYAYEQDETLTYETSIDGVGSVHVMGQAQAIEMVGKMLVNLLVEEIDEEGNFTTVTEVDIRELSVTMDGSPVPPPSQDIQMRTKMSPRGEILDLQLTQAVNQEGAQSPWNSEMAKMLTGGFDLNRMILGQKVAAFPEEAVKPGDEWAGNAQEVEVQGQTAPLVITTKYVSNIELEDRECAVLDSEACMQPAALGQLATMLSMEGSTTTQSRSWFDIESGRQVASMEKTQVSMQVSLPGEMTGAGGAAMVFVEMFVDTQTKLLPVEEEE